MNRSTKEGDRVPTEDVLIRVHECWNGWRSAEVRLADLEDVHWCQPAGAPHALIHGFVCCADLVSGLLPHGCDGSTRHRLRVCVLKHHATATIYADLARRASEHGAAATVPSAVVSLNE